jgi:hypothetical protein
MDSTVGKTNRAKVPSFVTPPKSKVKQQKMSSGKTVCWALLMIDGDVLTFDNWFDKSEYQLENELFVEKAKAFTSFEAMQEWKASVIHPKVFREVVVTETPIVAVSRDCTLPKLEILYRTTKRSSVVCLIVRFIDRGMF